MKNSLISILLQLCLAFTFSAALHVNAYAESASDALYQGLGNKEGIRKIVDDFIPLVLKDVRINAAFKDTDLKRLATMLTDQFCELSGGPCQYKGRDMEEAHRDMKVTNAQFNALAEDLQEAMDKNNIPSSVQNKLVAKLAPMQRPIVTK